ncbi:MAG: metalloregulator ArsR/SmtB family transcription factor [Polyangiaceae bacterium]
MLQNSASEASLRAQAPSLERWDLYRTLAEPLRLRLLALVAEEELAVGELADLLKESQPNVSRAWTPLRDAGLVVARREGTRVFLRVREEAEKDAVVRDALAQGRMLAEKDGSIARVAEIVAARDLAARAYFDAPRDRDLEALKAPPPELAAYLFAASPYRDQVALDAGTGDGGLIDVLSPAFAKVIAVDRSGAQLQGARARVAMRGYRNVKIIEGDLDSPQVKADVKKAAGKGVDVIFAVRMLHHASKPAELVKTMASLLAPGGRIVVLDYARHDDEKMRDAGDVWLGFDARALGKIAREARVDLEGVAPLSPPFVPEGPDAHLPWQTLVFRKKQTTRNDHHG